MRHSLLSYLLLVVAVGWLPAGSSVPAAGTYEPALDEELLRSAGLDVKPAALLSFFRTRTRAASEPAYLADLVRQLGSSSFEARRQAAADLLHAGHAAVPVLRAALADADRERAREAGRCLEGIRLRQEPFLADAAVRLLECYKPAGAAKTLLAYLPHAADTAVAEAILQALPGLVPADAAVAAQVLPPIDDRSAARRRATATLLGYVEVARRRELLGHLLEDADAAVRLQAACAALQCGDPAGIPALVALLEAPLPVAWQAEGCLAALAGADGPALTIQGTAAGRRQGRSTWEAWYRRHRDGLYLPPREFRKGPLSVCIMADLDDGRIDLFDGDGKPLWRVEDCSGPADVQLLPSGHLLIAENHAGRVTERDRFGRTVWAKKLPEYPLSCWRQPDGWTWVATQAHLFRIAPDGEEMRTIELTEEIYFARPLRDGAVALLLRRGCLVVVEEDGRVRSRFEVAEVLLHWSSFSVTSQGHFLVANCDNTQVVEFSRKGERLWHCEVPRARSAVRLLNGHALVCDPPGRRLVEVGIDGKVRREYKSRGRPWHVQVVLPSPALSLWLNAR